MHRQFMILSLVDKTAPSTTLVSSLKPLLPFSGQARQLDILLNQSSRTP